jgi:hypothetical protein
MSRIEAIARGLLVIGMIIAVATVVVLLAQRIVRTSEAPEVAELGPLLGEGDVVHDREREDLGTSERPGRSVLLTVISALDQDDALKASLDLLKRSGWLVSPSGGAVPRGGNVCLALSTPKDWLADRSNTKFADEFESKLRESSAIAVVVDAFFCSRPQR